MFECRFRNRLLIEPLTSQTPTGQPAKRSNQKQKHLRKDRSPECAGNTRKRPSALYGWKTTTHFRNATDLSSYVSPLASDGKTQPTAKCRLVKARPRSNGTITCVTRQRGNKVSIWNGLSIEHLPSFLRIPLSKYPAIAPAVLSKRETLEKDEAIYL